MSCVLSRAAMVTTIVSLCVAATGCESSLVPFQEIGGSVVTVVDEGTALSSARTFFLADTIIDVPLASDAIAHGADQEITANIRAHLLALGWRDAAGNPALRPDVIVLVAASTRTQAGFAYANWYGAWGYLPYWDAGVNASW